MKKSEHEGNKFDIILNSQNSMQRVVLKKPESSIVSLDKSTPAIIIENPSKVR